MLICCFKNDNKKNKKEKGFSLMELMIVLTILSLLMGVLVPSMGRVVQSSKEIALKAVVKSLQVTLETYFLKEGSYPIGSSINMEDLANILMLSGDLVQVPINPYTGKLYRSSDGVGRIEYSSNTGQIYRLLGFGSNDGGQLIDIGSD